MHYLRLCFSLSITVCMLGPIGLASPARGAAPTVAAAMPPPPRVIVPDQFATIQLGIDSGADTVLVRSGVYSETPVINRKLVLLRHPDDLVALPEVDGVTLAAQPNTLNPCVIGFLHSRGPLHINVPNAGEAQVAIQSCALDRSITAIPDAGVDLTVQDCFIQRPITLSLSRIVFKNNHVVGGGLTVRANGINDSSIEGNVIEGPADAGIRFINPNQSPTIKGNNVSGVIDGIVVENPFFTAIKDNVVQHCVGHGIRALSGIFLTLDRNWVSGCGGNGFDIIRSDAVWQDNRVDSIGLAGIHVDGSGLDYQDIRRTLVTRTGGHGIHIEGEIDSLTLTSNVVRFTNGDGVLIGSGSHVKAQGNVIGRCGARGLAATLAASLRVRSNTVYLNGGAGLELGGSPTDSVDHNVSYGNATYGLHWMGAGSPRSVCNDWFGNRTAQTLGTLPGASDLSVDPLFCDLPHDSVHVSQFSPVLNPVGCGLIGARGQGCTQATSVPGDGPELRVAFGARPTPATGSVHFSWSGLGRAVELSVYDVSGAKRWSIDLGAQVTSYAWRCTDSRGRRLAPGAYYAMLRSGPSRSVARLVLVR